jgi:hypothetical protein
MVNNETSFSLKQLLEALVAKAGEDGIITKDEEELLDQIRVDMENLESQMKKEMKRVQTKEAIAKLLENTSKIMIDNVISSARKDAKLSSDEKEIIQVLMDELGWSLDDWKHRNWFVFKICIVTDTLQEVDELLSVFDKSFCIPGIDPANLFSGLCLGTKHYVIDNDDVTLLSFALNRDRPADWVTKGSFATLEFESAEKMIIQLRRTAQNLIAEYYSKKKS